MVDLLLNFTTSVYHFVRYRPLSFLTSNHYNLDAKNPLVHVKAAHCALRVATERIQKWAPASIRAPYLKKINSNKFWFIK